MAYKVGIEYQVRPILEMDRTAENHVGAMVEALNLLGLVEDRDQVSESVTAQAKALAQSGRPGETYIQLPREAITLAELVKASDSAIYPGRKYPNSAIRHRLWTPGTASGGYHNWMLDNLSRYDSRDFAAHTRLAVHGAESREEPLVHFLGKPFDDGHASPNDQTQIEAIDEAAVAYEAENHTGFAMTPMNAKAVAFIALVRRIKGQKMPIASGYTMLDATLPRTKTGLFPSVVGQVSFVGETFVLGKSYGYSGAHNGVGLSVGPTHPESIDGLRQ